MEFKSYTVKVKTPSQWEEFHNTLLSSSSVSHIPDREVTCSDDKRHSSTRGTYLLTDDEAIDLREHHFVDWIELCPTCNPDEYRKPELDARRFKRNVKVYRDLFLNAPTGIDGFGSVYFDGDGDSLSTADNSDFDFGTGDFTIEFFANNDLAQSSNPVLIGASGGWYVQFKTGGTILEFYTGSTSIQATGLNLEGAWHHIVVSKRSNYVEIFVDGVLQSTTANSDITNLANTLYIGSFGGGSLHYLGYISNVRIVKGTAIYYLDGYGPSSTPVFGSYSNAFDGNTSNGVTLRPNGSGISFPPITVNSQLRVFSGGESGELYLNQTIDSGYDAVGSTFDYMPEWYDATSSIPSFPFQLTDLGYHNGGSGDGYAIYAIEVDGALVTQVFTPPTEPLENITNTSLLACNSSSDATAEATGKTISISGINNNAAPKSFHPGFYKTFPYIPDTLTPAVTGSVDFDGSGDYLSLTDSTEFDIGLSNEPFTIEAWVYPRDVSSVHMIINRGGGTGGWNSTSGHQYILFHSGGTLYFQFWNGSSVQNLTDVSLTTNVWVHLAVVYNGTDVTMYKDGTLVDTYNNATFLKPSASNITRIGEAASNNGFWDGYISNVRLVKGTALYTSNFTPPTQELGATYPGITGSVAFDGTGDALIVPDSDELDFRSDDFTIEGWYYPVNSGITSAAIFSKTLNPEGTLGGVSLYYASNGLTPSLSVDLESLSSVNETSSIPFVSNSWNHFAVVRNQNVFDLYVNGVSGISSTIPNNFYPIPTNDSAFTIGASSVNTTIIGPDINQSDFGTVSSWTFDTQAGTVSLAVGSGTNPLVTVPLLETGKTYFLKVVVDTLGGQGANRMDILAGTQVLAGLQTPGTFSYTFTADGSGTGITFKNYSFAAALSVTMSSIELLEVDAPSGILPESYISNFRIARGKALYTSNFTPPTEELDVALPGTTGSVYFKPDFTDVLQIPNTSDLNLEGEDFTIEAWVNVDRLGSSRTIGQIWGGTGSLREFIFGFDNSYRPRIIITDSPSSSTNLVGTTVISPSTWYHIAATRSGNDLRIFLNGSEENSTTVTLPVPVTTEPLEIGEGNMDGRVSNFRIVKGTALYTSNFTPPTQELTAITGTSVLCCQSKTDLTQEATGKTITVTGSNVRLSYNSPGLSTGNTENVQLLCCQSKTSASEEATGKTITVVGVATGSYNSPGFPTGEQETASLLCCQSKTSVTEEATDKDITAFGDPQVSTDSPGLLTGGIDRTYNSPEVIRTNWAVKRVGLATNGDFWTGTGDLAPEFTDVGYNMTGKNVDIIIQDSGVLQYHPEFMDAKGQSRVRDIVLDGPLYLDPTSSYLQANTYTKADGRVGIATTAAHNWWNNNSSGYRSVDFDALVTTGSVDFDGNGDYLTFSSGFTMGTGDFTVECFAYTRVVNQRMEVWINGGNIGGFYLSTGFNAVDAGPILNRASPPGSGWSLGVSGPTLTSNTWHHIAWVRESGIVSMYIDGVKHPNTLSNSNDTGTMESIGGWSNGEYSLDAIISNVRIRKGVALYTSNFTPPTEELEATFPGVVGSVEFDGTGDYLSLTDSTEFDVGLSNEPFTAELWAYPRSINTAVNLTLFGRGGGAGAWNATNGHQYLLFLFDDLLYFQWWNGTSLVSMNTSSGDTLTLNQWSHLAVVYDGTNVKVYRNGLEILSSSSTTFGKPSSSNITRIGTQPASGSTWDGYISNVRLVKGTALYTSNFTVPTEELEVISSPNLITNGTFDTSSSIDDWVADNSTVAWDSANQRLSVTRSGGSGLTAYLNISTVPGRTYTLECDFTGPSSGNSNTIRACDGAGVANTLGTQFDIATVGANTTAAVQLTFTALSTTSNIRTSIDNSGQTIYIDNLVVQEDISNSLLCCQSGVSATLEATGKTLTVNGNAVASTENPGLTGNRTYNASLLCCQSKTSATEENTGKTITANGNAVASSENPGLTIPGTGTKDFGTIAVSSTYVVDNSLGESLDGTSGITDGHGTACAGLSAGKNTGAAFEANIWNMSGIGEPASLSITIEQNHDLMKIFHKYKPINSETGVKNPTIINGSWGYRASFAQNGPISFNFRGTSGTYSGSVTGSGNDLLGKAMVDGLYVSGGNKSLSLDSGSSATETAADELMSEGPIYVASAGNTNQKLGIGATDPDRLNTIGGALCNHRDFMHPQGIGFDSVNDYHPVICIGAMDDEVETNYEERKANYSSNGPGVDVWSPADSTLAPGLSVDSLTYMRYDDTRFYDRYFNGTSAAAPVTTGVLALYLQSNPRATQKQTKTWLNKYGSKIGSPYRDDETDDQTTAYWTGQYNMRGAEKRILFNPYYADPTQPQEAQLTTSGVSFGGVSISLQ